MLIYRLTRGGELLGEVTPTHNDMFLEFGRFVPTPAFEQVRPLFERELALLDADRMDEWMVAWEEISAPGVRLEAVGNGPSYSDFAIHVSGDQAWWRGIPES
jgi:hypothetical protein